MISDAVILKIKNGVRKNGLEILIYPLLMPCLEPGISLALLCLISYFPNSSRWGPTPMAAALFNRMRRFSSMLSFFSISLYPSSDSASSDFYNKGHQSKQPVDDKFH